MNNIDFNFIKIFNPDLKKISNQLILKNIEKHKKENRILFLKDFVNKYPDFDIEYYKFFHKDLIKFNNYFLLNHYHTIGKKEKRIYSFNSFLKINDNLNYSEFITKYKFFISKYNLNNNFYKDKKINNLKIYLILSKKINLTSYGFIIELEKKHFNNILQNICKEYIDCNYYKSKYVDLKNYNRKELINHFYNHGFYEDRICSLKYEKYFVFNKEFYINKYKDLKHLKTFEKAYNHYIKCGKRENRLINHPTIIKDSKKNIIKKTKIIIKNNINKEIINREIDFKNLNCQIYVSESLIHLENRVKKIYNLYDYKDINKPCIFFGLYNQEDLNKIKNHLGMKYIIFGGSDFNDKLGDVTNKITFINSLKNYKILSISGNIYNRFKKYNIDTNLIDFNLVDRNLFKKQDEQGNKIYIYDGIRKKPDNSIIYNKKLIDKVKSRLPDFEYIHSSDLNIPYEKMPEIYKQCFIGLRLTDADGNANTVQEFETMNIPIIHNYSDYGIKWNNIDNIVNNINKSIIYYNTTIIINSYKPDKNELIRSINSCLEQINVKVNLLISTVEGDNTIKIVKDLNNNNIKLIICKLSEHPGFGHKGIYYQLNKALKEVKTKYFSYLSSNDYIHTTKSYNEIKKIDEEKSIFCFSNYKIKYVSNKFEKINSIEKKNINLKNLLSNNFINDCATIDLSKLNEKLEFNYEKYGNTCYWHLWISLITKYGISCMSYNNNIEWEYIRDVKKSISLKRENDINEMELYYNQREFMLSEFEKKISPKSIYNYSSKNEKFWWWNDIYNKKPIELTVALPALKAEKIIWLALESLKNQININFAWELIIFEEEENNSKDIVKSYKGLLPGCVRIIYKTITKDEAFYNIEDIKKKKCTSYYTLLEKWINIAKISDKNSKIFVKHAVDCYSPPKRLYIHYEHFKSPMCYYSTQLKGYFYNIKLDKYFLYDGSKIEPYNWKKYYDNNKLEYKSITDNKNVLIRGCHLNMSLRTNIMKQIPLPLLPKKAGLDGYILYHNTQIINISPEEEKIIFNDEELDKDNWRHSLDTDGLNNISLTRSKGYIIYDKINKPHCIPTKNSNVKLKIKGYIIENLRKIK